MKTKPSSFRGARSGALALAGLALCPWLIAQNQPATATPGQLLEISAVMIRPDKLAEYERIQKEEVNPALKKAGWTARYYFKGGVLNDAYLYGTAVPIPNLAFLDEKPLEKALGKQAADALTARIAACHTSKRVFVTRQVADLCWGQTFSPVAVVSRYRLATGRKSEWLKFMREQFVPAARKSDILGFVVEELVLGGNVDDAFTLSFWRNYADLDKGPAPVQSLGRTGYDKLMQQLPAGLVLEREAHVIEFREDLSFGPALKTMTAQKAAQ